VTSEGAQAFKRWLGTASAAPLIREDLRGKIAFLEPSDLPRMIDILRSEEQTCAAEYEAVHASMDEIELRARSACGTSAFGTDALDMGGGGGAGAGGGDAGAGAGAGVGAGGAGVDGAAGAATEGQLDLRRWRARMRLLLLRDEATVWLTRRQRLERMRAYLEDVSEELARARVCRPPRRGG
jgi:hypothetical protein